MSETVDEPLTSYSGLRLYRGSVEWSALYNDGSLVIAGNHENVFEELFGMLGVNVLYSDNFLDIDNNVAKTVENIERNTEVLIDARRTAEELRTQAAELILKAERLESRSL